MSTSGQRIYAIGDIHGCLEKLEAVLTWVAADIAAEGPEAPVIVCLGDYGDRGVQTRGVIDRLIGLAAGDARTVVLRGNHDQYLIDYLAGRGYPSHWPSELMGGTATLASYDIGFADGVEAARAAVGPEHRSFLDATELMYRAGAYVFVHAGIRPEVPLDAQTADDLVWIREPFLSWTEPHEAIVVHGHTPGDQVMHCGNRIAVDTGAVFGGLLSCVVLEGAQAWTLGAGGCAPLEPVSDGWRLG